MTPRTPRPADTVTSLLAETYPYLSCDECFARLDEYVEQLARDPHHHDPAMRTHLLACVACADEADALRELVVSGRG